MNEVKLHAAMHQYNLDKICLFDMYSNKLEKVTALHDTHKESARNCHRRFQGAMAVVKRYKTILL